MSIYVHDLSLKFNDPSLEEECRKHIKEAPAYCTPVFTLPRGTRDFIPEDMEKRRHLEHLMRSTFLSYGYREIQTPTFEELQLFTAKSGDAIIDELYSFQDKGGRDLALRPELTAPVIRCYVDKLQMEPKPLKLFYFGNCYRYDRPQKGRYREFQQAGCELIGTNTPEAQAELIALAYTILTTTGLKNITLRIGNLSLLKGMFDDLHLLPSQQQQLIPLIDKGEFEDVSLLLHDFHLSEDNATLLLELLQSTELSTVQQLIGSRDTLQEELTHLHKLIDLLTSAFSLPHCMLNLAIVRGLDYYKGMVFEIEAPALGAEKQLCGGGAYELVPLFGGRDTPTTGFAIGFDRTLLALELEQHTFPQSRLDAYIIPVNEDMITPALKLTQNLRQQGYIVDIDLMRRGIGKNLKHASTLNASKTLILGPREHQQQSVTLRDMKTGEQQTIPLKEIVHHMT
jgi:histidyl-tRNA synthetase